MPGTPPCVPLEGEKLCDYTALATLALPQCPKVLWGSKWLL